VTGGQATVGRREGRAAVVTVAILKGSERLASERRVLGRRREGEGRGRGRRRFFSASVGQICLLLLCKHSALLATLCQPASQLSTLPTSSPSFPSSSSNNGSPSSHRARRTSDSVSKQLQSLQKPPSVLSHPSESIPSTSPRPRRRRIVELGQSANSGSVPLSFPSPSQWR
jgi:hypothetical protein